MLKRRVKRDFIDLGNPPPMSSGGLSRGAQTHHQQPPQTGQQRQPMQMTRPTARPSLFLRPPNQAPAHQMGSFSSYQQQQPPGQTGGFMQYADNRRFGGQSQIQMQQSPNQHHHHQQAQASDQLEMNSSGPIPFFLHANFSNVQSGSGSSINKHRPPPPPIQMNAASGELQRSNQTFHYANETLRSAAPFNDPSWPLMWYLVSVPPTVFTSHH